MFALQMIASLIVLSTARTCDVVQFPSFQRKTIEKVKQFSQKINIYFSQFSPFYHHHHFEEFNQLLNYFYIIKCIIRSLILFIQKTNNMHFFFLKTLNSTRRSTGLLILITYNNFVQQRHQVFFLIFPFIFFLRFSHFLSYSF